jgi:putative salt-induced outer membrane protein YdiY
MLKKRFSEIWSLPAIFFWLLLLVLPAAAQNVAIHLKNGDRITGRILSESTNAVTVTNFLGSIQIPLNEIARREVLPAPVPVAAPTTSTNIAATGTNVVSGTNVVQGSAPAVVKKEPKPPLSPANPEATPIASTPSYWKHDLRFGLNMRYADKDSQEFLTILKSTYGKAPFRHIFDVNFKYGEVEGVRSANSLGASEKTEYQLTPKTYLFGLIGGGFDEIRRIDAQYEIGPGFGIELLKKTNFVWKSEMGFNFQRQYRDDDTTLNQYSVRIAEIFAWRVWDTLTADLKLEFFPNVEEIGEYRFRIESTLRYPVNKRLSLNLDVIDLYESQPVHTVKPNDLQIRSTIGVTF